MEGDKSYRFYYVESDQARIFFFQDTVYSYASVGRAGPRVSTLAALARTRPGGGRGGQRARAAMTTYAGREGDAGDKADDARYSALDYSIFLCVPRRAWLVMARPA